MSADGHMIANELLDTDPICLRDAFAGLHRFATWATEEYLGDECRYDHHGYCQNHGLDEKPCPVESVVAVLARLADVDGYE